MKEDLIVIPDLDVFKSLISDAKQDLAAIEADDAELVERRDLALDIVKILDDKIAGVQSLSKIDFNEKIWFAAHLYLLETVLEDLFEDEDDMFVFDEDEEVEAEEEKK